MHLRKSAQVVPDFKDLVSDAKEQRDAAAPCLASAAGSFSW